MIGNCNPSDRVQVTLCDKLMEVAGDLLIPDLNSDWFEDPRRADLWMGETFFDETKFPAPGYSADYNPSSPSFIPAPKVLENMELSTGSSEIKVASRDELVWRNLKVFHQSLLESLCSALGNASQEWQWRKLNPTLKNQNPAKKFIC